MTLYGTFVWKSDLESLLFDEALVYTRWQSGFHVTEN